METGLKDELKVEDAEEEEASKTPEPAHRTARAGSVSCRPRGGSISGQALAQHHRTVARSRQ